MKTAVEWLEQQLYQSGWEQLTHEEKMNICGTAKLIEIEQIIDAYETSHISMMTAKQYYNETYKSEE